MLLRSSAGIGYMNKRTALKAESTSEGKEWTSGQSEARGGMGGIPNRLAARAQRERESARCEAAVESVNERALRLGSRPRPTQHALAG